MREDEASGLDGLAGAAAVESERRVAWLRLAAIALIAAGQSLPHPEPHDAGFFTALGLFSAWSLGLLVLVYRRPIPRRLPLVAVVVDVVAVTALVLLSGGAFSQARLAYFVIPVAVAFRFRPALTAAAGAATVLAYLAQALVHPARGQPDAWSFIAIHAGYLAWMALAALLLSAVLARRTRRVDELASVRRRLLADALTAEERQRQALAESLHDHAIQNLLSARHDVEEAAEDAPHAALDRADAALAETVAGLRDAVLELHPYVIEEVGLEAALRAVGQRAARRGGFRLQLNLSCSSRHPHERLLLAAARELLANAAQHARAQWVSIRLAEEGRELVLSVSDDGCGFDPAGLVGRVREGHIGLATQRVRVESVGGRLEIRSAPGGGTTAEVRLPR